MLQNEEWLRKYDRWAILGINENPEGYANLIYHRLEKIGKTVAGVNPLYAQLEGKYVYPSLHKLPFKPDVVVSVVRPDVGLFYLDEMKKFSIEKLWLQPGSIDDTLLRKSDEYGVETLQACVLMGLDFIERKDNRNK